MIGFLTMAAETPGVYYAYQHSDGVGKAIVIFLVLVGSVVTWTVIIDKTWQLFRAKRLANRFASLFRDFGESNMMSMQLVKEAQINSGPVAAIYSAGMEKLLDFYAAEAEKQGLVSPRGIPQVCKISDAQYNAVEAVLEQEVSSQISELEKRIGMLATLVSLSPFCGLFGTVWGVIRFFFSTLRLHVSPSKRFFCLRFFFSMLRLHVNPSKRFLLLTFLFQKKSK